MTDPFIRIQTALRLQSAVERLKKSCHRLGFKWELRIWQADGEEMVLGSDTKPYMKPPPPLPITIVSNKPVVVPEEKTQQADLEEPVTDRDSTAGSV